MAVEKFEGPLDLMLHLIKEKQLDLFDLDINVLTDQYIAYLNAMNDMHLEIASEYLVELAELVEYKSRKLLPKGSAGEEEESEEDAKERLVRRLLEYQQYKEVSSQFAQLFAERQEQMTKEISKETEQWVRDSENEPYDGNPYDLLKAMKRCMMRMQLSRPIETRYTAKEVSMEDRELVIRSKLDHLPEKFGLDSLVNDCGDLPTFVATFLAILDLARQHMLVFTTDEKENVWFSRGTGVA